MGKLVVDNDCVFEIDEECVRKKGTDRSCDIRKYLKETEEEEKKEYRVFH